MPKLGLKGMKREEHEGNKSQEKESGLEDEFDRKFWIKVSNLYDFLNELFLN